MEFNFPSVHQPPSTYITYSPNPPLPLNFSYPNLNPPLPPNVYHFTQQSIQAGFTTPATPEFHRNPIHTDFQEVMRVQRELEKQRIRAEIIGEEIMRRRVLENEVRREMMMEREILMRLASSAPMMLQPRVPLLANVEHTERFGGVRVSPQREMGFKGFESMPFQRDPVASGSTVVGNKTHSSVVLQEIKTSVQDGVKEKIIILAKPSITSAADLKRKVVTEAVGATSMLVPSESKKQKTKDDWSCALCRVSATCERGLSAHLDGKKHKAKERGLLVNKTGFGTTPLPKKNKGPKSPGLQNSLVSKDEENSVLPKKNKNPKSPGLQNSLVSKDEENSVGKKNKPKKARAKYEKKTMSPKSKKNLGFWCEMCQVGAYAQHVLDNHKKGKRHLSNLLEKTKTSMENGANEEEIKQEKGEENTKIENESVENNPTTITGVFADVTLAHEMNNPGVPEIILIDDDE